MKRIKLISIFFIAALTVTCLAFSIPVSAADIDQDHVQIGEQTYLITDAISLVDADLALLRWRAKGDDTAVSALLDGQSLSGFNAVYSAVYDKLLGLYDDKSDESVIYYDIAADNVASSDGYIATECPTGGTNNSTVLWKITGAVDLAGVKPVASVGRVLIISEDAATVNLSAATSQFTVSGTSSLVVQGRSADKSIKLTATAASTSVTGAIRVNGGSLYLHNCDVNGFDYGSSSFSTIIFPTGNYARYLYMSDSLMRNVKGKEAPGIFCKAYSTGSNSNVAKSKLYINYSEFSNCITPDGGSNTVGGSAIRSYAADLCDLTVRNSTFNQNRVGSKTTAQGGTASGGGAIYWKSVSGKATLISCTFTENHSSVVGGAILNMGTMEIIGCHFEGNTALKNGGAITAETPYTSSKYTSITGTTAENKQNNLSGTLTLDSNTRIIGNEAKKIGGGIYFNAVSSQIHEDYQITKYQMQLIIDGAEISGNTAGTNGGGVGIYMNYDDREYKTGVIINDGSLICGNIAEENGGAIWINSAESCDCNENRGVVMNGGTLESNEAVNGGAIDIDTGKTGVQMNFFINGGSVYKNQATENGGAAYIQGGSVIMSGGTISSCTAQTNGGAIFVSGGDAAISGGEISECTATENGGAFYMTAGTVTLSGTAALKSCTAQNGGAIYMGGGEMTVSGGEMSYNKAVNGAGAYLAEGAMHVIGGSIDHNAATADGGGAYLAGGSFTVSDGLISSNTAINGAGAIVANGSVTVSGGVISENKSSQSGGAFFITNGNYVMTGGEISNNVAAGGDGGAIYVSSSQDDTNIVIRSGAVINNKAGDNGGALSVYGQSGVHFTITIGSNTSHEGLTDAHVCVDDNTINEACPIIKGNTSSTSGGGIYLSGSYDATMNMYCLVEGENKVGDGVSPSNFMKVDGGTLNISTVDSEGNANCGNIVINSSIQVTGGKVTLTGTGSNPVFNKPVTVDVDTESGSTFKDERKGGTSRTIQYFENFESSGQYTLVDSSSDEAHVVHANMYTIPGYEVDGWILMQVNADGTLSPTDSIYKAGDVIADTGDLIFYAKWVVVGYTVIFTPGVEQYKGTMQPQDFAYSDSKALSKNAFVNVGYVFLYWFDESDPTRTYLDEQVVTQLSEKHGAQITLVAKWQICYHTDTSDYTLTLSGNSATRQCPCLGYSETVTLTGVTVSYDANPHPATLKYDRRSLNGENPSEIWDFSVLYNGQSNGGTTLVDATDAPVDAGAYTAYISITADDTVTVSVTINRANRTESPATPQYTTEADGDYNIIKIQDLGDTTGYPLEYQFSWYKGESLEQSAWLPWDPSNPPEQRLEVTYTNYYVDVRYAQTPNYNASSIVRGTSVIVWTGNVTFKFSSGAGLSHSHVTSDQKDGITVTLTPLEGYYIYRINTAVNEIPGYTLPVMDNVVTGGDSWEIWIHSIVEAESDSITIEVTFTGAERMATVDSAAAKDEVFDSLPADSDGDVTVSRDSAFTVCFDINNYKHYKDPAISFSSVIPGGSTLIMIDRSDNSYWFYKAAADVTSISLADFVRMGSVDEGFAVDASRTSMSLQLIVDFSDCDSAPESNSITASFAAAPIQPDGLTTVPNMPSEGSAVSVINLVSTPTFSVGDVGDNADDDSLTQSLSYQFAATAGSYVGISRWDRLAGVLIIKPVAGTLLPADVRLQVRIGDSTSIYPLSNGSFLVGLPSISEAGVSLTLLSDMMPNEDGAFSFTVELYSSATAVNSTPDEMLAKSEINLTYSVTKSVTPAVKAEVVGELPKYENGKTTPLNFKVEALNVPANYTVRAVLYRKNTNGGYTSTTQTLELTITDNSFTGYVELSSFEQEMSQTSGSLSLMLSVEIVDQTDKIVDYMPLYFILVDTRQ